MADKFIMVDMGDERAGTIAEILSSKTAKNILSVISESDKDLSASDISSKLKLPLNTVDYNIKKLISSGLIEESKSFFWSVKGRKIKTFKAANKKIIISTKPKFTGLVASALVFGAIGFAANVFGNIFNASKNVYSSNTINTLTDNFVEKAASTANEANLAAPRAPDTGTLITTNAASFSSLFHNAWIWVACGVVVGLGVYFIYKKCSRSHFENNKALAKMQTLVKGGKF